MHELPVTESILQVVLRHAENNCVSRVMKVHLQVGKLSDLEDEWIQHYFYYLSKGTLAEGAKLQIERMPIRLECNACDASYTVDTAGEIDLPCPHCGEKDSQLVDGRGYFITNMEVL